MGMSVRLLLGSWLVTRLVVDLFVCSTYVSLHTHTHLNLSMLTVQAFGRWFFRWSIDGPPVRTSVQLLVHLNTLIQ